MLPLRASGSSAWREDIQGAEGAQGAQDANQALLEVERSLSRLPLEVKNSG